MVMKMTGKRNKSAREKAENQSVEPLHYGVFESPIGSVYVAAEGDTVFGLSFISKSEADFKRELSARLSRPAKRSDSAVRPVLQELKEYFKGKRSEFNVFPDTSDRTRFQQKVLKAAMSIPHGQTRTYGWLARRAGSPQAARAAGQVMAGNTVPIIIPCHRVIGSSGDLCGFAGSLKALDIKRKLLDIEGISI